MGVCKKGKMLNKVLKFLTDEADTSNPENKPIVRPLIKKDSDDYGEAVNVLLGGTALGLIVGAVEPMWAKRAAKVGPSYSKILYSSGRTGLVFFGVSFAFSAPLAFFNYVYGERDINRVLAAGFSGLAWGAYVNSLKIGVMYSTFLMLMFSMYNAQEGYFWKYPTSEARATDIAHLKQYRKNLLQKKYQIELEEENEER